MRNDAHNHEFIGTGGEPIYQRECAVGAEKEYGGWEYPPCILSFLGLPEGIGWKTGDRGGRSQDYQEDFHSLSEWLFFQSYCRDSDKRGRFNTIWQEEVVNEYREQYSAE